MVARLAAALGLLLVPVLAAAQSPLQRGGAPIAREPLPPPAPQPPAANETPIFWCKRWKDGRRLRASSA